MNKATTKDYNIKVSVRNNKLLKVMRDSGIKNAADLSRLSGVSQAHIGKMINLSMSAYLSSGEVRKPVIEICEFLGVLVDDIYPEGEMLNPLNKNNIEIEASLHDIESLSHDSLLVGGYEYDDTLEFLGRIMNERLNNREKAVLSMHFGVGQSEDYPLHFIAESLGVSIERVRQIESKALRKLAHPKFRCELATLLD